MRYDFDQVPARKNTRCVKWDSYENDPLPFWVADMDFHCPPAIVEAVRERVNTSPLGYSFFDDTYLSSVSAFYRRHHGADIPPEHIVVSPGVVPAFNYLYHLLSEPGQGVIIQPPVYGPFFNIAREHDRRVVENPLILDENNIYRMDYEDLERKCADPNNRILLLCSPHNPIGRVWTPQELTRAARIALDHGLYVLSDEIHCDLLRKDVRHYPLDSLLPEHRDRILTMVAPSKTFNIPGLALAHIFIHDDDLRKKYRHYMDVELHLPLANPLSMAAVVAAHTQCDEWLEQLREYLDGNIRYVCDYLAKNIPNVSSYIPEGTYLMWLDMRKAGLSSAQADKLLRRHGLALSAGTIYGENADGFMRFNVGCPRSMLTEGLERLKAALSE